MLIDFLFLIMAKALSLNNVEAMQAFVGSVDTLLFDCDGIEGVY